MAWVKTMAVVVPSPAASEVFSATSFVISTPKFSTLSLSSNSLAIVTPSSEISGVPNPLSKTTCRALGPKVTFTASVNLSMPDFNFLRADSLNKICLAINLEFRI